MYRISIPISLLTQADLVYGSKLRLNDYEGPAEALYLRAARAFTGMERTFYSDRVTIWNGVKVKLLDGDIHFEATSEAGELWLMTNTPPEATVHSMESL